MKTVLWVLRRGGGDVRGMLALLFAVKARPAVADAIVVPGKLASFVVK